MVKQSTYNPKFKSFNLGTTCTRDKAQQEKKFL